MKIKTNIVMALALLGLLIQKAHALVPITALDSNMETSTRIWRNDVSPASTVTALNDNTYQIFYDLNFTSSGVMQFLSDGLTPSTTRVHPGLAGMISHPNSITDLTGFQSGPTQVTLSWTTPEFWGRERNNSGTPELTSGYELRWAQGVLYNADPVAMELNYAGATNYTQNWQPLAEDTRDTGRVVNLPVTISGSTIYFIIKAHDIDKNTSYASSGPATRIGIFISSSPTKVAYNVWAADTNTLNWEWISTSNNEDGYQVMAASGGAISPILAKGTTYFRQTLLGPNTHFATTLRSFNSFWSTYSVTVDSYTLAAIPQNGHEIASLWASSIAVRWGNNLNPLDITTYSFIVAGNDDFSSVEGSSGTVLTTATVTGLTPNTSYWYETIAYNGDYLTGNLVASSPTIRVSTVTMAALPSFSSYDLTWDTVAVHWAHNNNPLTDTQYTVELSSDADFSKPENVHATTVRPTQLSELTTSFQNLQANTRYYARIRSINRLGELSDWVYSPAQYTYPRIPTISTYEVFSTSFTFNVEANNNPPLTRFEISTSAIYATDITSVGVIGADSPAMVAALYNLLPNNSYPVYMRAINLTSSYSSSTLMLTTTTLGIAPANINFSQTYISQIDMNWALDGNTVGTEFSLERSTDSAFAPTEILSVGDWSVALTSSPAGLSVNTTYHFRLRARNTEGRTSIYSPTFSTSTLVNDPGIPSAVNTYISSMCIALTPNGNPSHTEYAIQNVQQNLYLQTPALSGGVYEAAAGASQVWLTSAAWGGASGVCATGLNGNTQYTFNVWARNNQKLLSNNAQSVAAYTLAGDPAVDQFSNVFIASATVSFLNPTNNPAGTVYELQISSNANYSQPQTQESLTTLSFTTSTLVPNTSYFFKVRSKNQDNIYGNWVNLGSTVTLATYGVAIDTKVYITSGTASWVGISSNPAETLYSVEISSDNFQTIWLTSVTALSTAEFRPLQPGSTSYGVRVVSINRMGHRTPTISTMAFATQNSPAITLNTKITSMTFTWPNEFVDSNSQFKLETAYLQNDGSTSTWTDQTGWINYNIHSWEIINLSTNTKYLYKIWNKDTATSKEILLYNASTRTLAAPTPAAKLLPFSFQNVKVVVSSGSNPTTWPNATEFAVKVVFEFTNESYYLTFPTNGLLDFTNSNNRSNTPVWGTMQNWNNDSGILLKIPGSNLYTFYVFARNGNRVETSSSSSVQFLALPGAAKVTWDTGKPKGSWINFPSVTFTPSNSAHYHYKFNQTAVEYVNSIAIDQLDVGVNVENFGADLASSIKVTATSEGNWYFHCIGDNYGFQENATEHITSGQGTTFNFGVDLTSPTISNLQAQYTASDNTPITSDEETAQREIYFSWESPRTDASKEAPIEGYSFIFSTSTDPGEDAVPLTVMTSTSNVFFAISNHVSNSPDRPAGTYYFRVKAKDEAGNWGQSQLFIYKVKDDEISPTVTLEDLSSAKTHSGAFMAVASKPSIRIYFNKDIKENTLTADTITMKGIRNNLAATHSQTVDLTLTYDSSQKLLTVTPTNNLSKGWLYEFKVSTGIYDLSGLHLQTGISVQFETTLDPQVYNFVLAADQKTTIDIPAGALPENVSISVGVLSGGISGAPKFDWAPNAAPSASGYQSPQFVSDGSLQIADNKLIQRMGDFAQAISKREFNAIDGNGTRYSGNFNQALTIKIPYVDDNNDGYVDGTNPRVKVDNLVIYTLDETNNLWQRLPNSSVNKVSKVVEAQVIHFSVYAVFGSPQTDVDQSYAYPVPFKPARGDSKITFAFLPSYGTIRIYTSSGELVQAIPFKDVTDGKLEWNATNSNGQVLASDVYIYVIECGSKQKFGKIVVLR